MAHKFHGISLANNSTADNFHFERLAADPTPLTYGRIWFNTTENTFKYSSINGVGAIEVNVFSSVAALTSSINTLTTDLSNETSARIAADTAETNARIAAINSLNTALAQEVSDRTAADAAEAQARIDGDTAEAAARAAAIAVASSTAADATAAEAATRAAADTTLGLRDDAIQAELDGTQAAAGLNVDGTFTAPLNTTYLGAVTTLKAADVALDTALTAEVAARAGADASLSSGLANETQLRIDGDANLQAQLTAYIDSAVTNNVNADNAETVARIAGDAALQAELDATQATIGTDTNGNLIPITGTNYLDSATTVFGGAFILDTQVKVNADAIAAETAARTLADTNFNTSLQAEITTRTANDVAIQAEVDAVEVGAGLASNGAYVAATDSNYLNLATTLKDADHKLDAALKSVDDRTTAIETVSIPGLTTQITNEVNRATAAESAESAARVSGDSTNATAILDETSRATAAEASLSTDIASETTRATGVENSLQSQINSISAASGSGAAALQTQLNATRYTYMSSAPALVHTVVHNLNTPFYSANIMVQGADSIWRNDIMPVEDVDLNSYTITLSESAMVKASGQSNAQLV